MCIKLDLIGAIGIVIHQIKVFNAECFIFNLSFIVIDGRNVFRTFWIVHFFIRTQVCLFLGFFLCILQFLDYLLFWKRYWFSKTSWACSRWPQRHLLFVCWDGRSVFTQVLVKSMVCTFCWFQHIAPASCLRILVAALTALLVYQVASDLSFDGNNIFKIWFDNIKVSIFKLAIFIKKTSLHDISKNKRRYLFQVEILTWLVRINFVRFLVVDHNKHIRIAWLDYLISFSE